MYLRKLTICLTLFVIFGTFDTSVADVVTLNKDVLANFNVEKTTNIVTLGEQSKSFDFNLLLPKEGANITLLEKYVTDLNGVIVDMNKGIEPGTTFLVVFDFENRTEYNAIGEEIREKFNPRLIPASNAYLVTSDIDTLDFKDDWSKSRPLGYTNLQEGVILDVKDIPANTEGKIFLEVTFTPNQV